MEKIIKCDITLNRIMYPKNVSVVDGGNFAIFSANVIKNIENCENLYSVKLKGIVPYLKVDVIYSIQARLADQHEKYGDTYEIIFMNRKVDLSTLEKQKQFINTILDENITIRLFDMYGDKVVSLLEAKDVESLSKVKGIKVKKALKLIKTYEESRDLSVIFTELDNINLTPAMINRLVTHYKSPDTVVEILKKDPYKIVDVDGIGFAKADEIAQKMGVSLTSPRRVRSFIVHTLKEEGEMGKSYLKWDDLLNLIYDNLGMIDDLIINETAAMLMSENMVHVSEDGDRVGLMKYYDMEEKIYKHLLRLLNAESKIRVTDWKNKIAAVESRQGFKFNEDQMKAIEMSTCNNILAITGISGSGKSAATKGICAIHNDYNIVGGALSGIAGMRLKEATEIENAGTIHRMLGYSGSGFTHHETNQLDFDLIFIDEATMVNLSIFLAVLEAIPTGARVILLGDCEQLPPIGSGQVYYDVLNSGVIPTVRLLKPNRQSAKSGIYSTSLQIIDQRQLFNTQFDGILEYGELRDMVVEVSRDADISKIAIDKFMQLYNNGEDILDIQVITPMKLRGNCCTYNLNTKIQQLINPVNVQKDEFIVNNLGTDKKYMMKVGDKVINKKNDYSTVNVDGEKVPVFNGSVGIIKEIDIEDKSCIIDFVGLGEIIMEKHTWNNIELGYALTIHGTQGISVKNAITILETAAYMMLNSNLLYTAITRAKKRSILIGQNSAIRRAITNKESSKKQTYLLQLLKNN